MKKSIRFILILLSFATFLSFNVSAASLNDLKQKKNQINKELDETKKKVNELNQKADDVKYQISVMDNQISDIGNQISQSEAQLTQLSTEITQTQTELEATQKKLAEKKEQFNKRLRSMYMNGSYAYIEVMLNSVNIRDFLTRKDFLESIAKSDKKLIEFVIEQSEIIAAKKAELETKQQETADLKVKLEAQKKTLVEQNQLKVAYMKQLEQDAKVAEAQYDEFVKQTEQLDSQIKALQSVNTVYRGGSMNWPVPNHYYISSPYGYRIHPVYGTQKFHSGIDIPAGSGEKVTASGAGVVVFAGWNGGYGNTVIVDHGGGIVTLYAHNSSIAVGKGESVSSGQVIAYIGSTGVSTGPHSHFEVRKNGSTTNPVEWVGGN